MAKLVSPPPSKPSVDEEPDDYMSMTIVEPALPRQKETYTKRRIRKEREAEKKSRPADPSTVLSTALPHTSKGFQMLAKLGYVPGSTLGAAGNMSGTLEPVMVEVKEDRGGIGLANEKKRKFREEIEGREREERAEEGGFRERVAKEREARRLEVLVGGAMRLLETLDEESTYQGEGSEKKKKSVNVLYRGLVRQRQEQERERRARFDLHQSLSKHAHYQQDEEDEEQDRLAWGREEEDVDEEDDELDAFEKLEPEERLERLIGELRGRYWYCFWCKFRYEDERMEGCPGREEDDHD